MNDMDLKSVLDTMVKWFSNKPNTKLKTPRACVINTVFFLNRAKGQCINWRNLQLIFGIPEDEAKKYLKARGVNKLTWPKHIIELESEIPERDYTANLQQDYIETEGRFKGIRWGLVIFSVAKSTGHYISKEALQLVRAKEK